MKTTILSSATPSQTSTDGHPARARRVRLTAGFALAFVVGGAVVTGCGVQTGEPALENATASEQAQTTALGAAVVRCAEQDLGQRVGGGQCTDLVSAALNCAGACPASQPYVWGALEPQGVYNAGDVIQFSNATTVVHDGASTYTTRRGAPNHTAIIETVNGTALGLLEQNMNNSPTQRGTFNPATMTGGQFWVYRAESCGGNPQPPPPPPPAGGGFPSVAIAYSAATRYAGTARGSNVEVAQQYALRYCSQRGARDCRIMVTEPAGCVALWVGTNGEGTGAGPSERDAAYWGQHYCSQYTQACSAFAAVCGS